jgi:hypothetical protein
MFATKAKKDASFAIVCIRGGVGAAVVRYIFNGFAERPWTSGYWCRKQNLSSTTAHRIRGREQWPTEAMVLWQLPGGANRCTQVYSIHSDHYIPYERSCGPQPQLVSLPRWINTSDPRDKYYSTCAGDPRDGCDSHGERRRGARAMRSASSLAVLLLAVLALSELDGAEALGNSQSPGPHPHACPSALPPPSCQAATSDCCRRPSAHAPLCPTQ